VLRDEELQDENFESLKILIHKYEKQKEVVKVLSKLFKNMSI